MLEEKYHQLLEFGRSVGMNDMETKEEGGKLFIKGTTTYEMEKHLFWDKIKTFADWENEIAADIKFENQEVFGIYEVKPGDSLSKISKGYLGDPMKYMEIYNLNTDILSNPDNIKVGQKLKLPFVK